MYCSNCGKEFESNFCPNCGTIASKPDINATEQQQPLTPMQTQEDNKKQEPADSSAKEAIEAKKNGFSQFFQSKRNIIIAAAIAVILVVAIILAVVLQPSSNLTIEDFNIYKDGIVVKEITESPYSYSLSETEETKRGIKLGDTFSEFADAYAGVTVEVRTDTSSGNITKDIPLTDLQNNKEEYLDDESYCFFQIAHYTINGEIVDKTSYEKYIRANFQSEFDDHFLRNDRYVAAGDKEGLKKNIDDWHDFLKDNNMMCLTMSVGFERETLTYLETNWPT